MTTARRPASLWRDLSLSAVVAGFVAVLVGYTSAVAIVFQAAQSLGATPAQTASWMWALGLGMGATSLGLSLWTRQPVLVAWSTPGAAVLVVAGGGVSLPEAVGAFIVCAVLIIVAGWTGWFERLMNRIPMALASALLAGVLARFGMDAFLAVPDAAALVLPMFAVYLLGRRWWPRWCIPAVLLTGIALASWQGQMQWAAVDWSLTRPVWVSPQWTLAGVVGVALPLFVVTMASQNLPGVAAIRAAGYDTPVSPLVTTTGVATLLLAPFGAFALNLAAITAALCMSREAHEDPARRYVASAAAGVFYLLLGVFGAAVAGLLIAFPQALILAVAGFALLGTIGAGLATAMREDGQREAALVTFLVTLSGVSLVGIGSAFWGVVAGALVLAALRPRTPAADPPR